MLRPEREGTSVKLAKNAEKRSGSVLIVPDPANSDPKKLPCHPTQFRYDPRTAKVFCPFGQEIRFRGWRRGRWKGRVRVSSPCQLSSQTRVLWQHEPRSCDPRPSSPMGAGSPAGEAARSRRTQEARSTKGDRRTSVRLHQRGIGTPPLVIPHPARGQGSVVLGMCRLQPEEALCVLVC